MNWTQAMDARLVRPREPVRVALIGAGQRAWTVYRPLLADLRPWLDVVAVCDTQRANADRLAEALGAPAFNDIHALLAARPMEAALVITPLDSHYAISMALSMQGVHNLVETPWCATVAQGRRMLAAATENGVVARVGENFFRMPIDRVAQAIDRCGFLGPFRRIVSYADSTGYHNNARWLYFNQAHPTSVQSFEHTTPTVPFRSTAERRHTSETYRLRAFAFPDNRLVVDHAANIKGFLGRQRRPGYTEWQGEAGTIIYKTPQAGQVEATVWYLREEDRDHVAPDSDNPHPLTAYPIVDEFDGAVWTRSYVDLPIGRVEHVNLYRPTEAVMQRHTGYGASVMNHVVDFALAVRGLTKSEFSADDALMALMMVVGASESARRDGQRVALPLADDTEADTEIGREQRGRYGVDPLDWEAMLTISFPKR